MKYQVIAINEQGEYVGYEKDIFKTEIEAETFIGIEGTQMEADNVEFHILKLMNETD
jgi:hypothetical protein